MFRTIGLVALSAIAISLSGCGSKSGAGALKGEPIAKVAAPGGKIWSDTVVKTEVGGYKMGNPAAKLQLLEYGAITCPACADFAEKSSVELKTLVDTGVVSFEYRPYLIHGVQDLPGFLLAQCNGPDAYFGLSEKIYAEQANWLAGLKNITATEAEQIKTLKPAQAAPIMAAKFGLVDIVKQYGVSEDAAKICLSDQKAIDGLIKLTQLGAEDQVTGTPHIKLNGNVLPDSWDKVKEILKEAGAR
jgi:protein-disulfide isomerase